MLYAIAMRQIRTDADGECVSVGFKLSAALSGAKRLISIYILVRKRFAVESPTVTLIYLHKASCHYLCSYKNGL